MTQVEKDVLLKVLSKNVMGGMKKNLKSSIDYEIRLCKKYWRYKC